jgi:hypothetical protein
VTETTSGYVAEHARAVDLKPATPEDLAGAALQRPEQVRDSGEIMARIVAERLVDHLERSGFVIMKSRQPWAGQR